MSTTKVYTHIYGKQANRQIFLKKIIRKVLTIVYTVYTFTSSNTEIMKTTKKFIATNLIKRDVCHGFGQSPYRYSVKIDGQVYKQEHDCKVTTTDTSNTTFVIADAFTKDEFINAVYNFVN